MKTLIAITVLAASASSFADEVLVYEGESGPGQGKHIVFIANDHEYRSEQSCPAMAKILAKHLGFKCTVLFGVDDQGMIKPGGRSTPGMEVLKDADLLFFFTRFMNLPDKQVDHLVDYFEKGGPVVGLRTSTHCFNGQKGKWEKLNYNYKGDDYHGGLGERIFGNTWERSKGQSHYGQNHQMGCRITPVKGATHPILNGVSKIHAFSGAYKSQPPEGATELLDVQVLNTFGPGDDINKDKPVVNAGWAREGYTAPSGAKKKARVVYTSMGASEDILSEDARRFLVNACLWAGGWESRIKPDLNVSLVGGYSPTPYSNGGYYFANVKPTDLAGWDSHIMPKKAKMFGVDDPKWAKRAMRALPNRPYLRKELVEKYPNLYGPDAKLPEQKRKK